MHVPPFEMSPEEIRKELQPIRTPLSIAVERSKNPFNVGAIIRVAHSFLVREIVLIGDEPYYEKASMGMEKYENIVSVASEAAFVERCRRSSQTIVAIEKDHAQVQSLWHCALPQDDAIFVFGSENSGVSAQILGAAAAVVAIPMFGINHSYPVSVAAGIVMAEWSRRYWAERRLVTVPRARGAP